MSITTKLNPATLSDANSGNNISIDNTTGKISISEDFVALITDLQNRIRALENQSTEKITPKLTALEKDVQQLQQTIAEWEKIPNIQK